MGKSGKVISLDQRLQYYRDRLDRILFEQSLGRELSAGLQFHNVLHELTEDCLDVATVSLTERDKQIMNRYSESFYSPALLIVRTLYEQQAAFPLEGNKTLSHPIYPINLANVIEFGKPHIHIAPFADLIKTLKTNAILATR